jgi:hypothetical protein
MTFNLSAAEELARMYENLQAKRDRLQEQLDEVTKDFEAVAHSLKLMGAPTPGMSNLDLSNMTHIEALIAIAKANDNLLVVKTARRLMNKASLFKNPRNASSVLFTAINRSGKFKAVPDSKGKYELIDQEKPAKSLVLHLGEPGPKTSA